MSTNNPSILKILLVEDNVTNQKLVLRQLQTLGYSADVCDRGQAAVEAATQQPYDVILMDCQLPDITGFEVTKTIRDWEYHHVLDRPKPTVIIALTASDTLEDYDRAVAAGMDDYLVKPVRKETLANLLAHWFQVIANGIPSKESYAAPRLTKLPQQKGMIFHLDFAYLNQLADDNPDFALELLQLFVIDSQFHLNVLQQAVATLDFEQIQHHAHHLKGASANVGARVIQITSTYLEEQAIGQQPTGMEDWVAKIAFSLNQIQRVLQAKNT